MLVNSEINWPSFSKLDQKTVNQYITGLLQVMENLENLENLEKLLIFAKVREKSGKIIWKSEKSGKSQGNKFSITKFLRLYNFHLFAHKCKCVHIYHFPTFSQILSFLSFMNLHTLHYKLVQYFTMNVQWIVQHV